MKLSLYLRLENTVSTFILVVFSQLESRAPLCKLSLNFSAALCGIAAGLTSLSTRAAQIKDAALGSGD